MSYSVGTGCVSAWPVVSSGNKGALLPSFVRYAFDPIKSIHSGFLWSLDIFENPIGLYLPTVDQIGMEPICGRLGMLRGSKRRIFAIVSLYQSAAPSYCL